MSASAVSGCDQILVDSPTAARLGAAAFEPDSPLGRQLLPLGITHVTIGVGSLKETLVLKVRPGALVAQGGPEALRSNLKKLPQWADAGEPELAVNWSARSVGREDPRFNAQRRTFEQANVPPAWERIRRIPVPPVAVAVIDTGVRSTHPDLTHQMWSRGPGDRAHGQNFSGGALEDTDDRAGHGTEVAGVLASESDNGEGIASIPWRDHVRIVIAKFEELPGSGCTQDLINAIDYAANDARAPILNLSVGLEEYSAHLKSELELLAANNPRTLIVAAVSNADIDLDAPGAHDYPTDYRLPNVISVQGSNCCGGSFHTAYGATSVQLAAPADDVQTTSLTREGYCSDPGTSMAAPQVSATAALIIGFAPQWNYSQVRQYLIDSARNPACGRPGTPLDDTSLCGRSESGGILNVDAATGGPIVIDLPFEGASWSRGSSHTLHWHELFATEMCPQLQTLLSTDDGRSWQDLTSDPQVAQTRDMKAKVRLPPDVRRTHEARIALRCVKTARLERWSDRFEIR